MKIQVYLGGRNCYNIAVVIIILNFLFELMFQYHFETKLEGFYFLIAIFICAIMIRKNNIKYLSVFYYFWPAIILFISCFNVYRLCLLPFVISSFMKLFLGKFKNKFMKIIVVLINSGVLIMYLLIGLLLFSVDYYIRPTERIVETVYSSDNKYVMNLEEVDLGATGGSVKLYVGRNIDFGILGRYTPTKIKYWSFWGERPELFFVDDSYISVNGEILEIKGNKYIDEYYHQNHD